MEKFITLNHLKMAVQSLLTKFGNDIDTLDNSLSPVAKTGSYNDLTNKPNINLNDYLKKTTEDGSITREYTDDGTYVITANDDNGSLTFGLNSEYLGAYAEENSRVSRMNFDSFGIEMEANEISINGVITPTNNTDAANKKYVDDVVSSITIPTTVSSFTNDSGYQNSTQVQTAINTAIGNINSFEVAVVLSLPASNIDDHTIYFVPQAVNSSVHDEYMYINNNWELIGTTAVDLSGYLQTSDIADWAKASTKPTYTASEVGAIATTHAANAITATDISNWNAKSNFSGSYNDLTNKPTIPAAQVQSDWNATTGMGVILNKPTIPTVPTNISSFTNDSGYLTLADLPVYDGTVENASIVK